MKTYSPLYSLFREGVEEIAVHGEIAVATPERVLFHTSAENFKFPVRSLLKPFQFLACDLPIEEWRRGGRDNRYIASLGSISATPEQVDELKKRYSFPEWKLILSALKLPESFPMDESFRKKLLSEKKPPSVFYHTCFSKHVAILKSCAHHGWEFQGYNSTSHPYHEQLCRYLNDRGVLVNHWVSDGCSLPTPVLSLSDMAKLYAKLVAEKEDPTSEVRELMLENPEWIGGPTRVDSRLMKKNPRKLVAKEGADGLFAIAVTPNGHHKGLGIVLKIYAGYFPSLFLMALVPIFKTLGLQGAPEIPKGQEYKPAYDFSN